MIASITTIVAYLVVVLSPAIVPVIISAYCALSDRRRKNEPSLTVLGPNRVALSTS
jgi:hypothetical protein